MCELNVLLGETLADAALAVIAAAGLEPAQVDLIASHGQTIHHVDASQGPVPSTLQIGEGAERRSRPRLTVRR